MGVIVRTHLDGKKFMQGYPQVREMLQQAQWLEFIEKLMDMTKKLQSPLLSIQSS